MKDPYSVLGVSQTASDAEIKKAYRELVRKYHPDNYHNNPLADLASEKMKEINEAYDEITKMRSGGGNSGASYSAGRTGSSARPSSSGGANTSNSAGGYGASSGTTFYAVREMIKKGDLSAAERMLFSVSVRNAEWNFLMGSICYKRGWTDDARRYFQIAVNMAPGNAEYRQAFAIVNAEAYPYRQTGYGMPTAGTDACDICTALMCTNLLCGGCRF